ncbi:MAG: PASTA domain-containing protein [Ilumatobacteraceae bacterium]
MSFFENNDLDSLVGSLIDNRFVLVSEQSRSTSSTAYFAVDQRTGQDVVVRLFSGAASRADGTALLNQAAAVAQLSHPNLVPTVAYGRVEVRGENRVYVAQERLAGGTLADMLDRNRFLSPSQALVLGVEVCRALDYAHKRGFVHHDLRPSAIMFGEDRKARVADLGVVSVISERAWSDTKGISMERARYAAPEQATGGEFDEKADVYALALVLVEAVSGQVPFLMDSVVGTLSARVNRLFPVSADLSGLASVLERAGRSDPSDRSSAAEMGRGLVQAAPTLSRPAPLQVVMMPMPGGSAERRDPSGSIRFGDDSSATLFRPSETTEQPTVAPSPIPMEPSAPRLRIGDFPTTGETSLQDPTPSRVDTPTPSGGIPRFGDRQGASGRMIGDVPTTVTAATPPRGAMTAVNPVVTGEAFDLLEDEVGDGPSVVRWIVVAVAVLVVIAGGYFVFNATQSKSYAVPALAGLDQGSALNLVTEFAWNVETVEEFNDDIALGQVIRTDPPEGSQLRSGGSITFFVSSGPSPVPLTDIVGMKADTARMALTDAGFVVGEEILQYSDTVPEGSVLGIQVAEQPNLQAGAEVVKGTTIDILVSQGPTPAEIPSLIGLTVDSATALLENLGLKLNRADTQFSSEHPAGAIIAQSPAAGELLAPGKAVTVSISRGPDLVTVPDVRKKTLAEATALLEGAGFAVGTVEGNQSGKVSAVTSAGTAVKVGQTLPRGTAIDLKLT